MAEHAAPAAVITDDADLDGVLATDEQQGPLQRQPRSPRRDPESGPLRPLGELQGMDRRGRPSAGRRRRRGRGRGPGQGSRPADLQQRPAEGQEAAPQDEGDEGVADAIGVPVGPPVARGNTLRVGRQARGCGVGGAGGESRRRRGPALSPPEQAAALAHGPVVPPDAVEEDLEVGEEEDRDCAGSGEAQGQDGGLDGHPGRPRRRLRGVPAEHEEARRQYEHEGADEKHLFGHGRPGMAAAGLQVLQPLLLVLYLRQPSLHE
mmetsp:Transcript_47440/g.133917  ORF Transcript_47440/g.133917 Transcript_47440/m.133917 type:complete len:263 (+) Transcript_47440:890-1678(+)